MSLQFSLRSPSAMAIFCMWATSCFLATLFLTVQTVTASDYLIGVGSSDITGPAADVNMMGYANTGQTASGIHFRLRARTFIVAEPHGKRVAFVNLDACMASQLVTIKVIERLKARFGNLYTEENIAISGIHTHAGPGGYLQYVVYLVTSLGFVRQSFDVIVEGIEESIIKAHENLRPGSLLINKGELLNASINRSPSAYLNNPENERMRYEHDVDKDMTLLKFVDSTGGDVAAFNWFATHGTSMSRTNSLISGDNKGAAARFMEDWHAARANRSSGGARVPDVVALSPNPNYHRLLELAGSFGSPRGTSTEKASLSERIRSRSGVPEFVAAFCQTNCGDVSPNVLGAFCEDTGAPCDFNRSTCGGKNEKCYGRGPGYPDEFESTRVVAERQFRKAADLFGAATEKLRGKVDHRHVYLDFSDLEASGARTCPAAMGFAFAAGTTDGPGAFDFTQGDDAGNPFWRLVRDTLKTPSRDQVLCQHPKPILLDTGEMNTPYQWAPSILPLQILRVGGLVILSVPAEFTTMAGRRLREAVRVVLTNAFGGEFDGDGTHVVIAGLTNAYSQYVTTAEEYAVQRYEGASCLYGPHTLAAYIRQFEKLAASLLGGRAAAPSSVRPPDLLDRQISLLPPVVVDAVPPGTRFGDVADDVPENSVFHRGEAVAATFWSACPRNDLMTGATFALVEMLAIDGSWLPVYDDDDWSLQFRWFRPRRLSPFSKATVRWAIPDDALSAVYRLRHFGTAKRLVGSTHRFTGSSTAFVVA